MAGPAHLVLDVQGDLSMAGTLRSQFESKGTVAKSRYFFHSFPRRKGATAKKGLAILESIVRSGLLLTPELIEWREIQSNGRFSEPFTVAQKRVCFTESAIFV